MFRSKLKVTKKSPRGAPSKAKKKKDISSYFVAPIPRQPSHPNFSQGSQSFQQFCSVSQSNTQQLHVSASMNNSAGDFVFRGNAKKNKRINFNDSQGARLFSSGSQAGGGNERRCQAYRRALTITLASLVTFVTNWYFHKLPANTILSAGLHVAVTNSTQPRWRWLRLNTPLDQPAQAMAP